MAWQLNLPTAHYSFEDASLTVDLSDGPRWRLASSTSSGKHTDKPIALGFELQPSDQGISPPGAKGNPCSEAYVRQNDLVAFYAETSPWRYGYQLDFRVWDSLPGGVHAVEVWLSVSTSLLASFPEIAIKPTESLIPFVGDHVAYTSDNRAMFFVHPLDQGDCRSEKATGNKQTLQWVVFGSPMEKGVIRRARFLFAWSAHSQSRTTWSQLQERFADSPLPLTA